MRRQAVLLSLRWRLVWWMNISHAAGVNTKTAVDETRLAVRLRKARKAGSLTREQEAVLGKLERPGLRELVDEIRQQYCMTKK